MSIDCLLAMKTDIINYLRKNKWPLLVAVAAVAVRVIYLLQMSRLPESMVPLVDERWHWEWAQEILNESFWGEGAYFRAPLYPYFLAFLAWITSGSILASKILQVLLSGGTAWLLYRLAEHLFNRSTAIIAGRAYALYGTLVFYETMLLIPSLFLLLTIWGMYRVVIHRDSASWRTWLITGIIFGLAALSRPNILLVIPFLLLWMYLATSPGTRWLNRVRLPAVMAAGVLLIIAPVTLRNAIVTTDFILISSQGGINLYLGNNPEADGLTMLMPEVDLDESVSWREFRRVTRTAAEREVFRELSEAEQSSFWTKKALRFMADHPGPFLTLVWKKSVYFVSGYENSDHADLYHQRTKSSLYSVLLWNKLIYFPFGLLLPLTLVGFFVTRKQARQLWPVYIFILAYIPTIVLFLVTARHRLPLVPFMILLASAGLVALWRSWRNLGGRQLAVIAIVFLGGLVIFNRTYYDEGYFSPFQTYFNDGIRYAALGDLEQAERAFLMADRAYPYSPALLGNLA
ncbi:MAG: glycosyltransferase family 39 protein, partial [Candidatus Zixiibacteriota bacterium]